SASPSTSIRSTTRPSPCASATRWSKTASRSRSSSRTCRSDCVPDDLYGLIGVEPDATTDEIRDQYRTRRSELDAVGTEQSRADAAALNRAWNILSDPYQRGRYDA